VLSEKEINLIKKIADWIDSDDWLTDADAKAFKQLAEELKAGRHQKVKEKTKKNRD
jgi:hypothetical protein